jgi:hypothetical protein
MPDRSVPSLLSESDRRRAAELLEAAQDDPFLAEQLEELPWFRQRGHLPPDEEPPILSHSEN